MIIEALKQLDANNDDHWTTDGHPRLDAVKELMGGTAVSREEVTKAAPAFSRSNLELPNTEPQRADGTPRPETEATEEVTDEELGKAIEAARKAQERVNDLQNRIGRKAQKAADPGSKENPIRQYLERQQAALAERKSVLDALNESGLKLGEIQKTLKAPIDAAMARDKNRGRPTFTPKV